MAATCRSGMNTIASTAGRTMRRAITGSSARTAATSRFLPTFVVSASSTSRQVLPQTAQFSSSQWIDQQQQQPTTRYYSTTLAGPWTSISSNNDSSSSDRTNHHRRNVHQQSAQSSNDSDNGGNNYVSPFQDIFDTIDEGKTFLGTSQFQAPTIKYLRCGIPEHALKFKTTSYGRYLEEPFVSPNEHKVTLQCHIRHIPLETDAQRLVLKEIVGQRLNDETGVLQLSSSQFGSRIENKRHAVSMLERVVERAKTLADRVEREVQAMDDAA